MRLGGLYVIAVSQGPYFVSQFQNRTTAEPPAHQKCFASCPGILWDNVSAVLINPLHSHMGFVEDYIKKHSLHSFIDLA